jgi:hypothetical protein
MKYAILALLTFTTLSSFAGLTIEDGKAWAKEHNMKLSEKFEVDMGEKDHAAPVIVTRDGGLAIIGDYTEVGTKGVKVVMLNAKKEIIFSHFFGPYMDNLEAQAILEDRTGHFYAIMETHDKKDDSDTRERVVKFDHDGKIAWDIALEQKENHYHRHCNTITLNEDGKHVDFKGTVQPDKTAIENKEHYKWTGKLDAKGSLKHEVGEKLGK